MAKTSYPYGSTRSEEEEEEAAGGRGEGGEEVPLRVADAVIVFFFRFFSLYKGPKEIIKPASARRNRVVRALPVA